MAKKKKGAPPFPTEGGSSSSSGQAGGQAAPFGDTAGGPNVDPVKGTKQAAAGSTTKAKQAAPKRKK